MQNLDESLNKFQKAKDDFDLKNKEILFNFNSSISENAKTIDILKENFQAEQDKFEQLRLTSKCDLDALSESLEASIVVNTVSLIECNPILHSFHYQRNHLT